MTPERPLVTHVRVSTSRQGRSGLGLDARRAALVAFAQTKRFRIVREFVEVDAGKGHDRRPQAQGRAGAREEAQISRYSRPDLRDGPRSVELAPHPGPL